MSRAEARPSSVTVHENLWIPMPDGRRLAARVWLPEDAASEPVPAILEYLPYRKRDLTRHRDATNHPWFAARGYASVRVDIAGSGESDGVLTGEYLTNELEDGADVIRWLADQPWCDGKVGMIGISWGGFNGLQIAALQPPALKAVISVCSTDDRYADDVHYMGGCLLGENLHWAASMFDRNTAAPDPLIVGERWRAMWLERLEGSGHWLIPWLEHQRRDAFWQHGSVCQDLARIRCPVYAVGGWADGYSNAVFRLLQGLKVPAKGLVGPWAHRYPHDGIPGPAIGFLQEARRWFDHWLKGIETGIMAEPQLRVWMQESVQPQTFCDLRPGRWVAERSWPSPRIRTLPFILTAGRALTPDAADDGGAALTISSPLSLGMQGGKWCGYARLPDLPADQREEADGALGFESAPLEAPLEILGAPVCTLEITSDRPVAQLVARLIDVRPDGFEARVTYGVLNLTHRRSHEHPEPLVPAQRTTITLQMNDIAHAFPAGHRIRLALSTSYWPIIWPAPAQATLAVISGTSRLELPVREPAPDDAALTPFEEVESAPPLDVVRTGPGEGRWEVRRDLGTGMTRLEVVLDEGVRRITEIDLELGHRVVEHYSHVGNDYDSVRGEVWAERAARRDGWAVSSRTHTVLTSDATSFRIEADVEAFEGERRVFGKAFDERIRRDLV